MFSVKEARLFAVKLGEKCKAGEQREGWTADVGPETERLSVANEESCSPEAQQSLET